MTKQKAVSKKKRKTSLQQRVSRERNVDRLRDLGCVVIVWLPNDVQTLRESWSYEKCLDELSKLSGDIEDRSIAAGWDALEMLLPTEFEEEEENDD